MTPWAWCIKEGIEPWRVQKRPFLSHVQVSLLLLSLSSPPLALLCFYGFIIIIIIYYVYLFVKGIITVTNKPGPEYSKYQRYKPGYLNSKDTLTLTLSLSLFPNDHCMWAGYLQHTILPAGLVAIHRCRLSHLYNINSLAFSSHSPLSLFPHGHCMWAGYLPHTILPAGLVALHRCRLSHLYNINSLAFSSLLLGYG